MGLVVVRAKTVAKFGLTVPVRGSSYIRGLKPSDNSTGSNKLNYLRTGVRVLTVDPVSSSVRITGFDDVG
jgi:hypothetical protein